VCLQDKFKFHLLGILLCGIITYIDPQLSIAQTDSLNYEVYELGFNFQEGIYTNFGELKYNKPSIQQKIEKKGSNLWVLEDSTQSMVVVDPKKVWGYSQAGNVYISFEGAYWRIIDVGQLSQFTAIIIKTFTTVDAFGFPIENQTKSLSQLFLDMNDGTVYELTVNNLSYYIKNEPQLYNQFQNTKRIKSKELVLALKAYNQLHPLYFPVYE